MTDQQQRRGKATERQGWALQRRRFIDQIHLRLADRVPPASGFAVPPEPRGFGDARVGRDLVAGRFLFDGQLIDAPDCSIWKVGPDTAPQARSYQTCAWLDDLWAEGGPRARCRAQRWVFEWIDTYDSGRGPGWEPDITAARLIHWIDHAPMLLRARDEDAQRIFIRSLTRQTAWLSRRWKTAAPGLPSILALSGLIEVGLALDGLQVDIETAALALGRIANDTIGADGTIASRNPEVLLEILEALNRAARALADAGRPLPIPLMDTVGRIAPVLRALRNADGGLARFHGGGRGAPGRLDQALAGSESRARPEDTPQMGYARLAAGRTTLIIDVAPPLVGPDATDAHASTLAFELTSGRRPLIVNCGSGTCYGPEWRRAGRATPSHSALVVEGYSSSRLGRSKARGGPDLLSDAPREVASHRTDGPAAFRIETAQDGWRPTHGLTHARRLALDRDGAALEGEDLLTTLSPADERRFDRMARGIDAPGIAFSIRFHLHPEVGAEIDRRTETVLLRLRSGESWEFRHDGGARLSLMPSVYLEKGRLRPRPTQQVVLSGRAIAYATLVRWSLAKTRDTPRVLRDLLRDDEAPDVEYGPDEDQEGR